MSDSNAMVRIAQASITSLSSSTGETLRVITGLNRSTIERNETYRLIKEGRGSYPSFLAGRCRTSRIFDSMPAHFLEHLATGVTQFWPKRHAVLTQTGHSTPHRSLAAMGTLMPLMVFTLRSPFSLLRTKAVTQFTLITNRKTAIVSRDARV